MLIKADALIEKAKPPHKLIPWLIYQNSLTQKLKTIAGDARLQVLNQKWELPDSWDKSMLNLRDEQVMHREILMWAWHEPCWYARTILPFSTYNCDTELFNRLKNESMGELIFNETKIKRACVRYYSITDQSMEYLWLNKATHQNTEALWVRFSEFTLQGLFPFVLLEILLPELMRYCK